MNGNIVTNHQIIKDIERRIIPFIERFNPNRKLIVGTYRKATIEFAIISIKIDEETNLFQLNFPLRSHPYK
jgi:hypothetical protein